MVRPTKAQNDGYNFYIYNGKVSNVVVTEKQYMKELKCKYMCYRMSGILKYFHAKKWSSTLRAKNETNQPDSSGPLSNVIPSTISSTIPNVNEKVN